VRAIALLSGNSIGPSIQGLIALSADLAARKIGVRSLTDGFDTSTASGRLLFHTIASVAEMERELIKERTIQRLHKANDPHAKCTKKQAMSVLLHMPLRLRKEWSSLDGQR
jgi:DNA invertase Pin-like site-specific DNA recombinase